MRSKKLNEYDIIIPKENCWRVINILGGLKSVHFKNLNKLVFDNNQAFNNRKYEDLLYKISEFEQLLLSNKIKKDDKFNINNIDKIIKEYIIENNLIEEKLIENIEKKINNFSNKTKNCEIFINEIKDKILDLHNDSELIFILDKNLKNELSFYNNNKSLSYITGIIKNSDWLRFQKLIFRLTKGNVILFNFQLDHNSSLIFDIEKEDDKTVIFLSYKDKKLGWILEKIFIIFNIKKRFLPNNISNYWKNIKYKIKEAEIVYKETKNNLLDNLWELSSQKNIFNMSFLTELKYIVIKFKTINSIIGYMKIKNSLLFGKFWIPESKNDYLLNEVDKLKKKKDFEGIILNKNEKLNNPPTFILNNKFMNSFQSIVNIYGIPNYNEINPGIFTVVTFPFLFGVMFGDIFHGIMILLFSIYLIINSDNLKLLKIFKEIRYFFLIIGIFAFYNGLIYNDFTSIYPNLFGSCYKINNNEIIKEKGCIHHFGIDSIWGNSNNDIEFGNSYKMKLAIIIGVIHMSLGILIKGKNCLYNKNYLSFIFEFIPQIIFFLSIFGYMVILIILKWLHPWQYYSKNAPSIIEVFISFYQNPKIALIVSPEFQGFLQRTLLFLSAISVPLMLIPIPLINHFKRKNENFTSIPLAESNDLLDISLETNFKKNNDNDSFSEVFIHQAIETIEFVLASVSNTASYLRLWALSLAHSQLSKVFYELLLSKSILFSDSILKGSLTVFTIFIFFIIITFGVLMIMDFMECFLHSLRLHWVEFQNKFFKGDGYLFKPLDFNNEFIFYN